MNKYKIIFRMEDFTNKHYLKWYSWQQLYYLYRKKVFLYF